jgi:hypothetical protein
VQLAIGLTVPMAIGLSLQVDSGLIRVPEVNAGLLHAYPVAIVATAGAIGGFIGGRHFLPIAALIALGLFALAIYVLIQIATPVESATFGSILVEVWPWAVLPVAAGVLGAWTGQLLAARRPSRGRNEI